MTFFGLLHFLKQQQNPDNIKLQLEIVTTDMCRLFHADYYRQRLLCTYLGPGTEWLDHSNVNRHALGKGRNNNIVKDETAINRANTFDVLILKGKNMAKVNWQSSTDLLQSCVTTKQEFC